jgi:Flp pilus assembly protein TadD
LPRALDITLRLHQAGRLNEAERGYRQILAVDPRLAPAVQGYGRLLGQRGNRAAAEKLIKAYQAGAR